MRRFLAGALAVLALVVGVVSLALLPGEYADHRGLQDAEVCADESSCLVPVEARITGERGGARGGRRWHVEPLDPSYDDAWVRFDRPVAGDVLALYWDGSPVAAHTADGLVGSNRSERDAWTALLWVGLGALALAAMWPAARWARGRPISLVPVAVVLGCLAAVFPTGVAAQATAAGITTGAVLLLFGLLIRVAGRARA